MGRQPKQGLDYFPFDVGLLTDPKLRRPRRKYGYLAQVVYVALLSILYRDKGYYIPFHDEQKDDLTWQISEILTGRYPATEETILNVIDSLTACGLFSGDLYQRGIITSKRAQENYYSATLDRKTCFVDFDLWLLSENDMKLLGSRSVILHEFVSRPTNFINRPINSINNPKNDVNRSESTQSKAKQSKVKQSKAKQSKAKQSKERDLTASPLLDEIAKLLCCEVGESIIQEIVRLREMGMQDAVILNAAYRTKDKQPNNAQGYFRTLLKQYETTGIWTLDSLPKRKQVLNNGSPPTDAPLSPWEKEWIARVKSQSVEKS